MNKRQRSMKRRMKENEEKRRKERGKTRVRERREGKRKKIFWTILTLVTPLLNKGPASS